MQRGVSNKSLYEKLGRHEVRHIGPSFMIVKKMNCSSTKRAVTCPTSHPSGNQVDGLPLVAHVWQNDLRVAIALAPSFTIATSIQTRLRNLHILVHAKGRYDLFTR